MPHVAVTNGVILIRLRLSPLASFFIKYKCQDLFVIEHTRVSESKN